MRSSLASCAASSVSSGERVERRGIIHAAVEPVRIERVAEIVMRGDVAPAAAPRVGVARDAASAANQSLPAASSASSARGALLFRPRQMRCSAVEVRAATVAVDIGAREAEFAIQRACAQIARQRRTDKLGARARSMRHDGGCGWPSGSVRSIEPAGNALSRARMARPSSRDRSAGRGVCERAKSQRRFG